ncbi:MAG TPA: bifunctional 23S rRNA (guanine(2069)-N(7))-methyltransferase RlmK/23S rRNA (guanine(2445)-N(2))-methyltransferase RlmL [Polyangia bacterium]|nr:bifunctional 23S rRNA (guanine(2069)-N(7))-methyltransferase RlmK/23S rRNA (guanine(2445)-N(2))-methyltransferase RlmL [Polyangia bacterium]
MQFFATCAKALEPLVAAELRALGATDVAETRAGVSFAGGLDVAYRACLWSRVASRVLLPLATFDAPDDKALYDGVRTIPWREHVGPDDTIAVDASRALKVKDAIVDQIRDETGRRPSVDTQAPDVRVNVHLADERATVSIDLSGDSLHRRGWRATGVEAPLKENLAAAILALAEWPKHAGEGKPLLDPMCGSGTLPIEAALIAADVAPGLARQRFGFHGWRGHVAAVWKRALDEARGRRRPITSPLFAFDHDERAIRVAHENARRAGVAEAIDFRVVAFADAEPPSPTAGVVVMNPPYGERLGETLALGPLYEQIGSVLRHRFTGWDAFVLSSNPDLQKRIGLRPARRHVLFNGALECRLLELPIAATAPMAPLRSRASVRAEAFANRLQKNYAHRKKWAAREDIHCWRVYDADLVEYAVAVDLYENAAHVQEYAPPSTIDPARAEERLSDVLALVPDVLGVAAADVYVKQRRRQRPPEGGQYGRQGAKGKKLTVREGGHQFLVNLSDYLDTGLFLDHRRLRAMIQSLAHGKSFLNLFAYTASATVYAAAGGARSSVSVDLSNTYLDWAAENFALNRVSQRAHTLVRSDVDAFLADERHRFDLIFCAPPTFSNSKGAERDFDVKRDHPALIAACARLLADGGVLLFSNHFRKFKMDEAALPDLQLSNISKKTLPLDFERDPRFHNSWRITKR